MNYKLKNPLSLGAGQALIENSRYINDWALGYMDYLAKHRADITGYKATIIRDDVEEAARIVKRNMEAVEKEDK